MFPCEDSKHVSVCPHPEKRNHHSFINISPTLVIDTSMERSSRVLHHGNPKIWFFFQKKFVFWLLTKSWNHLCFVNISPTLVIDSLIHQWKGFHEYYTIESWNPNIWFFFLKFEFWLLTKSWNHLSFVNIRSTLIINISMEKSSQVLHHGNPKIWFFFFFKKIWNSNFDFWQRAEITLASSISVLH